MANLQKYNDNSKLLEKKYVRSNVDSLLLVSSKQDADLINSISSNLSVFATPTDDRLSSQLKRLVKAKKTAYKEIYVLGNDRSKQEENKSFNIAVQLDVVWINTRMTKDSFNISQNISLSKWIDSLEPSKRESNLKSFLMHAIGSNSKVRSYTDDSSSIEIPHCYKIHFDQYLGQTTPNKYGITPVKAMHGFIKNFRRIMVQSNAGTGKTTWCQLLVHQGEIELDKKTGKPKTTAPNLLLLRKNAGIERVIIGVPTNAIGTQLHKDFLTRGLSVTLLDNQSTQNDLIGAEYSNVIISCYDSVRKIPHLIDNKTLVIIDEFHQLSIDIEYRNKEAFRFLIEKSLDAKRTLFMSATPNYFYALGENVNKSFGFKLIKGVPSIQNKISLVPIIYDCRRLGLLGYVIQNTPKGKGTVLCKFDSITNLQIACEVLKKMGVIAEYLCSKIASQKQDNETYNSIMETGYFKFQLAYLLYTTLMEAGVSIKESIKLNVLIDTIGWQKTIQLISRSRYNHKTGVNKNQEVWLFRSAKYLQDYTEVMYKKPIVRRFKDMMNLAKTICNHLNSGTYTGFKHKTESDPNIHYLITYYDEKEESYKPCLLYILRIMHEQSLKVPFELTLKRIERFDNRITVQEYREINPEPHPDFEQIREEYKEEKKKRISKLEKLFLTDFRVLASSICHLNRDKEYSSKILALFDGVSEVHKMQREHFILTHEELLRESKAKEILDNIYFFYDYNKSLKLSELTQVIIHAEKATIKDIKSQIERHLRTFDYKHKLNNQKDRQTHEREQAILKKLSETIRNDRKGIGKGWRTSKQYQTLINNAIRSCTDKKGKQLFRLITDKKALVIIGDLYHIEKARKRVKGKKDNKEYSFKLIKRKTIQEANEKLLELIEECSQTEGDF